MQRRQTCHMGLSNARLPLCSWEWEICLDLNLGFRKFLAFWHFGEWPEGPQNDWRWKVLRIERMEWNVIEDWCKLAGHVFAVWLLVFAKWEWEVDGHNECFYSTVQFPPQPNFSSIFYSSRQASRKVSTLTCIQFAPCRGLEMVVVLSALPPTTALAFGTFSREIASTNSASRRQF